MKPIITQLTLNVNEDEKTARQSNRQAGEVDKGMKLILAKIAEGDSEIIPDHDSGLQLDGQTIIH